MILKNYTSTVPVGRTIARLEELLAEAGAANISKDFRNGKLACLTFSVVIPSGKTITFRMPSKPEAVFQVLWKEVRKPHKGTRERITEQAERTAWKILQDSLEIDLTKLRLQQSEFMEIFLPYIWDGEQTLFEKLKAGGFKQLPQST